MKIMVASDIHGSSFYCKKMLNAFMEEQADKLLLLGDLLYHGPRNRLPREYNPKRVITYLNALKQEILCVRGNCDSEVDQMVLQFPILAEYCFFFLGKRMIFVTHGHVYNKDNLPMLKPGDILLHGHTHVPACEQVEEYLYLNPGSVSLPKEKSAHGYMTMDEEQVVWKDMKGRTHQTHSL